MLERFPVAPGLAAVFGNLRLADCGGVLDPFELVDAAINAAHSRLAIAEIVNGVEAVARVQFDSGHEPDPIHYVRSVNPDDVVYGDEWWRKATGTERPSVLVGV